MGRRPLTAFIVAASAAFAVACGSEGIELDEGETDQIQQGAELFVERCSGCHTLDAVGAEGSAVNVNSREYKDGPNFNQRIESEEQVLYAIRNGGFSSGPMPQNIVVGEEAEAVAAFLAKYSGREAERPPGTETGETEGETGTESSGEQGGENP